MYDGKNVINAVANERSCDDGGNGKMNWHLRNDIAG